MQDTPSVSVVVPTLNEADNIAPLLQRIAASFASTGVSYEVVIVDDHSVDTTVSTANQLASTYPVRTVLKDGKRGKAHSLLQGFREAKYPLVAMIDADLQYPPEALAPMYKLLVENDADVVVTERKAQDVSAIRKLSTKIYSFIFARLLFGINFDTQSGLKLFRKEILDAFEMTPSPWSFDLEFLVRSLENKYKIISHPIVFAERTAGVTKVKLLSVTWELASASVRLRLRTSVRKLRAGYRANTQFLKKAFPAAVVGLAFLGAVQMSTPMHTSALALQVALLQTAADSTPQTVSILPDLLPILNDTPTPSDDTTSPAQSSTQDNTDTADQTKSSNSTTTQGAQTATAQPASDSPTGLSTINTATSAGTIGLSTSNSAPATVSLAKDGTIKNAPATGIRSTGIYASTYPSYKISNSLTSKFLNISRSAIIVGALLLAAATAFSLVRKRQYAYVEAGQR